MQNKKITKLFFISMTLLALSLTGCSSNTSTEEQNSQINESIETEQPSNTEETQEETTEEIIEEAEEIVEKEPCPLVITEIFDKKDSIDQDTLNITVTNEGSEAVKYFEAYAVFWDNNGYPLKANFGYDEVVLISSDKPNLPVGESATWSWQPYVDGDDFGKAEVYIAKVELYDGTVWEDATAQANAAQRFTELNKDDAQANDNTSTETTSGKLDASPLKIVDIFDEPDSIGDDTLNLTVKNVGTEAVKYFEAYAVFWDNNGYPLKANFGYDETIKINYENPNLSVGDTVTWSWQPYVDGDDFGKAEVFISKVELYDGSVFEDTNAQSNAAKRFNELNK